LSTLFLFAKSSGETGDIPFAQIESLAREQRISAPQFSGVADDGSLITIGAKSAKPQAGDIGKMTINDLSLNIDTAQGGTIKVRALGGEIDSASKTAQLTGLARLETSNGYVMETNGLLADLETGVIRSDGALEVRAPFGSLTAGRVTFQTADDTRGQQMLFTDGVRLVYTPTKDTSE